MVNHANRNPQQRRAEARERYRRTSYPVINEKLLADTREMHDKDWGEETGLFQAIGKLQSCGEVRAALIVFDLMIERLAHHGYGPTETMAQWRKALVGENGAQPTK